MTAPGIGTLRETSLHAGLKAWYAQPGDALEARVEGYVVDVLRGETVIEIQTHHFAAIRRKLLRLVEQRPVQLVYPIAQERWIVRVARPDGPPLSRRKSPRRGHPVHFFNELVSFPELLAHPNFTIEVLLVGEEEVRCPARRSRGRWRRDWRVCDRRLLRVVDRMTVTCPADCLAFVPLALAQPFTSRQLAEALGQPVDLGQKMTYCLRRMGTLTAVGREGRATTYGCG
jgi:hypothetical protein